MGAELVKAVPDSGFDRRQGGAEFLGHFAVGQASEIGQDDGFALQFGQARQGSDECLGLTSACDGFKDFVMGDAVVRGDPARLAVGPALMGPDFVYGFVVCDGHQPARRATNGRIVFRCLLPDPDEDFLCDVLAEPGVDKDTANQAEDPSGCAAVKLSECLVIALRGAQQKHGQEVCCFLGTGWTGMELCGVHHAFRR